MGYSYEYSQRCLELLGRETDIDALAMESMNDIGKRWEFDQHKATYHPKDPASVDTLDKEVRWRHLVDLLSHPWFSRSWIIQGADLAPECLIFVGGYYFKLPQLQSTLYVIYQHDLGNPSAGCPSGKSQWWRTLTCLANLTKLSKVSVGGGDSDCSNPT